MIIDYSCNYSIKHFNVRTWFTPYLRPDARGLIVGITQYTSKEVLCRAALEAVCFQTREVLDAMQSDSKYELSSLLVDGAMSQNNLLM